MAARTKLAKFTVTEAGGDFALHIEGEAGQVLELVATRDQIDLIADSLDDLLSQDDSADEIEGEDDEDGGVEDDDEVTEDGDDEDNDIEDDEVEDDDADHRKR